MTTPWRRPVMPARDMLRPCQPPVAEPDIAHEPDAHDEADKLAAMPDADFYRQLRQDVEGVAAGLVTSITDAVRSPLKDRPWSRRHKRRDRHGKAF